MKTCYILLVALLAIPLSPVGKAADQPQTAVTKQLEPKGDAEFEAAFLAMMIAHHTDGIRMARMTPDHAESQELKQLMSKSVKQQEAELRQMTAWLAQWHQKLPGEFPVPAATKQAMEKDLKQLNALTGAEFDKAFAEKMAAHHAGGIAMAEMAVEKAQRAEVKQLAQKIVAEQSAERSQLLRLGQSSAL